MGYPYPCFPSLLFWGPSTASSKSSEPAAASLTDQTGQSAFSERRNCRSAWGSSARVRADPKTLNPKTLNPKLLNPKPQQSKP